MDILGAPPSLPAVPMSRRPRPATGRRAAILSSQVRASRHFFLDLKHGARRDLTLAYGGYEQCNPDYLIQRDGFVYDVLELVAAGRGVVAMNGRTTQVQAGAAYLYGTDTRLEIRADPVEPMAKYFLCFTGAGARERLRLAGLTAGRVRRLAMFSEVQAVLEDLLREGRHQRRMAVRLCAALTEVLLLKIEELTHLTGRNSDVAEEQFLRCKGLIDAQTAQLGTLTQITALVGVEASHLCRLFRRYQGLSPYQYLLRRKMAAAAEHLMDASCLVKQAAERVGFTDPYHFSRCFRKAHGLPPREFQRSLQRS